jgi:5-oxoprolinase (ATP-hydrolysing) subunit A
MAMRREPSGALAPCARRSTAPRADERAVAMGASAVRFEAFGDAALRVRFPAAIESPRARALLEWLRAHPGVVDAVVTERHAVVTFEPGAPPAGLEVGVVRALEGDLVGAAAREHVIGVRYDGADLQDVARQIGCTAREVVYLHVGAPYEVAAVGFLPGFAYLRGLDARLRVPRRPSPRPRVAAGSLAIAGPYTGVYPWASPGGWNLLGTVVGFAGFDVTTGAALGLGDRVLFVEVGR